MVDAGADKRICAGSQVTLGGSPTATGGQGPYTYQWSPATGLSSATVANPVATGTTTRTYTLTVTDSSVPPNIKTDDVQVEVLPRPNISLTSSNSENLSYDGVTTFRICEPGVTSFAFNISSSGTAAPGATYEVTWGNGSTGTFTGPTWTATQTYPLGLTQGVYTIRNPGSPVCTQVVPFNVFIGEVPLGGLSVVSNTTICTGNAINFQWNDFSTNPPGTLYIIDYGDGQADTVPHPPQAVQSHTYDLSSCTASNGQFSIGWKIINPCDFRDAVVNQIRVSQMPSAAFTISADTVCWRTVFTMSDQSLGMQAPGCSTPRHLWNISPATYTIVSGSLGDVAGQPNSPGLWNSGSAQLTVRFDQPGTYTITDVTGNVCGQNTSQRTVCVEKEPEPSFTLSNSTGCNSLVATVDNTSQSPNSCRTRYQWEPTTTQSFCGSGANATYTNGTTSSSFEPSFLFSGAGVYNVRLRAINSCGNFPVDQQVTVGAPPQVTLGAINDICAGESITPQATFTACGTPITGYGWAFPNGSPDTVAAQVPGTIAYATLGQRTVRATATSSCGPGMASAQFAVNAAPAAPLVPDTVQVCPGEDIVLSATPVSGVTFTWSGPNNFSSTQTAPVIQNATAAMAGLYTVRPSSGGCTGPASTVVVTVSTVAGISITPASPAVCSGQSIIFTASGASGLVWTLNGAPQGTGPSVTITPTQSGIIEVAGAGGACPVTASMGFTVNERPLVAGGPARVFCDQSVAEVMQPGTSGGTWSGPHVTGAGVFTPDGVGVFDLDYTVVSAQSCSTTVIVQVRVDPTPSIPVLGSDTLVCLGSGNFQLAGSPSGGTWSGAVTPGGLFTPDQVAEHVLRYTVGVNSCAVRDSMVVEVVPAEVVTVGADFERCISAAVVPLTASPSGGTWTGAGISGSTFSPMFAGAGSGEQEHMLVYSRTDANGCTSRDSLRATVHALPIVDAGDGITFCDQPFPQQLSGYSPLNGVWAGDHVSATGVFTPGGIGQFTLTYTVTDIISAGNLCVDSAHVTVTVVAIDNPADAGPDREACIGSPSVSLTGSPGGGTWSSVTPGSPWITAAGVFTPGMDGEHELIYSEGSGSCVTSDRVLITVHPLPQLAVTSVPEVCPDAGLQTATATPVGGWWTGAGIIGATAGTFDPAMIGEGVFELTYHFTDANSCTDSLAAWATVNPMPEAGFTHAPIACAGAAFPFADESTGNTAWSWRFGDGASSTEGSPEHVYGGVGTYDVMLTVSTGAGCRDSVASTVEVWEGPSLAFTAGPELEGCAVLNVEFENSSTGEGLDHHWDLGNGATSSDVTPLPVGYPASAYRDTTYTITLRVTNLCASVDSSVVVTVHPSPTALFGPDFDTGCSPWPVTFSNVSIGEADSFHWDFGDGTESVTMDSLVTHTYITGPDAVTRLVRLTATNACGVDEHEYTITVQPNTITAFFNTDTTSGCSPLTVNFTQYSIGVTNWHWDLGDGNVSTAQNVTHAYGPGTWLATLYGDNECSYDTVSVVIEVSASPQVTFDIAPQPVCAGDEVRLTNLTSGVAGTTWDLGDGGTSTLSILSHTYATAGTYDVTLNVVAIDNGCPGSHTRSLVVAPLPVAAFAVSEPVYCAPATLLYTNNSQGSQLNSTWRMDGDPFSHLFHPLPQQTTATGPHVVSLVVTDPLSGCRDSTASNIMGYATPEASFILEPVDPCGDPAVVMATNTSSSDALVSWRLDGVLQGTQSHLVTSLVGAGEHLVELVAEMPGPCLDTARTSFTLHQLPIPAFTADTSCVGQSIPITDGSQFVVASWWYFNDTLVGTDPYTALKPIAPGPDTVMVVVMGEGGCLDSLTRVVNSYPSPTAFFSPKVEDDCETVRLVAPEHDLMSYEWVIQGQHWSNDRVTRYHYGSDFSGMLDIELHMTNIHGCSHPYGGGWEVPSCVYVPNTFTPNGDLVNDEFGPSVVPFARTWTMWIFDRWGQVVQELDPARPTWNGEGSDGEELPIGVYNWRMTHVLPGGASEQTFGHVSLVR